MYIREGCAGCNIVRCRAHRRGYRQSIDIRGDGSNYISRSWTTRDRCYGAPCSAPASPHPVSAGIANRRSAMCRMHVRVELWVNVPIFPRVLLTCETQGTRSPRRLQDARSSQIEASLEIYRYNIPCGQFLLYSLVLDEENVRFGKHFGDGP